MTSWGRVLNFQTTVSQHGTLFGSEEAEYIVKQLDKECEEVTGDPQLCISTDRTRQYTVDFFDQTNCFHDILTRFVREDGSEVGSAGSDWSDKWAVLFGARSMQLGVAIKDKDKDLLRAALHRLDIRQEARKQMEKALEQYMSNGCMWDFDRNELSKCLPLAHTSCRLTAAKRRTRPWPWP